MMMPDSFVCCGELVAILPIMGLPSTSLPSRLKWNFGFHHPVLVNGTKEYQ
jgi:hypothetical protein